MAYKGVPYNASTEQEGPPIVGRVIFPDGNDYRPGRAYPGGPPLAEYGVELNKISSTSPSLTFAPIPEPEPIAPPPMTTTTMGATGTPIFSGFLQDLGEYNHKFQGRTAFPIYEKMRRSDADVKAALSSLKLPIRAAEKQIIPGLTKGDPGYRLAVEMADFVRENLFGGLESATITGVKSTQSFESVEENALLMLDFGCAVHEDLWTIDSDKDKVRLRKLAPRLPLTLYRWWSQADGETLTALEQYGYRQNNFVNVIIPAEKMAVFTHDKEGSNWYGRSALRAAYAALALDTPIPTPNGWSTIEDVQEGDEIFDENGAVQTIIAKSQIWKNRPCYEVTFNDGSTIIADEKHLWLTESFYERNYEDAHSQGGKVRTTEELFKTQFSYTGYANHSIVRNKPVQYPKQDLLVDPYVLGLWLGDGSRDSSRIATHVEDTGAEVQSIIDAGYKEVTVGHNGRKGSRGESIGVHGLITQLKKIGATDSRKIHKKVHIGKGKLIPPQYLIGDVAQRKALLAGLLDSDGSVNGEGQCSFSNTNRILVDGAAELARSLGESVNIVPIKAKGNKQQSWSVRFAPLESPFRLARKTNKLHEANAKKKWNRHRHYITSVRKVESRDTVCIEVSGASKLFLVGESFIPTHNSWYIKNQLYRIDAIALERNGMGIPTFKMPVGWSSEDKATAQTWASRLTTHEQAGFALPPGWEFEITGLKGRLRDPAGSIQHHSEEIVKSVLAMFLNLGTTKTGSRSLGNTMLDFFFLSLEATARNIASTINEGTIRRLCDYNWTPKKGERLPYPKLVYSSIVVIDPVDIVAAVKDLNDYQSDMIQSDDETENWFRRKFGMPIKGKQVRARFAPIQQRVMESPAPGETPEEIESEVQGGAKAHLDPVNNPALTRPGANPPVAPGGVSPKPKSGKKSGQKGPKPVDPNYPTPEAKSSPAKHPTKMTDTNSEIVKLLLSEGTGQVVCVDFDGVLHDHHGNFQLDQINGEIISEGKRLVNSLQALGYKVVVFTARTNHKDIKSWLKDNGVKVSKVTSTKMPEAIGYIDDRAVPFTKHSSAEDAIHSIEVIGKSEED